jgi:hypothetical protein
MNLEIKWKEAAVTYFKLFGIRLTGLRKGNKKYVRIDGGPDETRIEHIPNMNQLVHFSHSP